MMVLAKYANSATRYAFEAPDGTKVGDELAESPNGRGAILTVTDLGDGGYTGSVKPLYPLPGGTDGQAATG